jgi:predicted transcriptional regulator
MDKSTLEKIENSGFKKKHIAKILGVTPTYLSMCMIGTRTLSRKKENKLNELLSLQTV